MEQATRSLAPAIIAGAAGVITAAALVIGLSSSGWEASLESYSISATTIGLALALIGALAVREDSRNVIGWLLSVAGLWAVLEGLCAALATVVPSGSSIQLIAVMVQGVWPPPVFLFLLVPQLYPHGHVMSPRWRIPFVVTAVAAVASTLAIATSVHALDDWPELHNPIAIPLPETITLPIAAGGAALVALMAIAAVIGQGLRMRRVDGDEQARIAWLMAAVILMILAFMNPPQALALLIELAAIACLGIGIVRYRLFDIGSVLSRSLVYGFVIVLSLGVALAVAAVLGSLSGVGILPAVAAAVTALALGTAFGKIKQTFDWLLFGRRSEPGKALAVLGDRLAEAPAPDDVLPVVVTTLAESLRLPYAAVTLVDEDEPAAWAGAPSDRTVTFPLLYGGRSVGSLDVGLRRGERELSSADQRLVSTFAAQAGAAAHGAQVTRDLRRSRERLVRAREEERRVMRRELHDGIGPTLAGMSLGLQSLQRGATTDEQARLAGHLLDQARTSLDEVRALARDLRPAALDELGLVAAVQQHSQATMRMTGGNPDIQVIVPGDLPELPAAVEVAAYRIIQEGLTNAVRHAQAGTCRVELSANGSLLVRVDDDGSGVTPSQAGAGLRSMRERAEELGGRCTVTFAPGAGTSVCAVLPLPGGDGHAQDQESSPR